jgi:ABC-type transport system substrate-binding protein
MGRGASQKLKEGRLDFSDIVEPLQHYLIRKQAWGNSGLVAHLVPGWGTLAIWANCNPALSPMANPLLRSAIAELIPWKDQIQEQAVRPSRMARCFWPPDNEAFDPTPQSPPDPARAAAKLDQAGWKQVGGRRVNAQGKALQLVLYAPKTSRYQYIGHFMAQQAQSLGFTLECRFLSSFTEAREISERQQGDLWINALFHGISPDVNIGWFLSNHPSNFSGYSNLEVDRLFLEASQAKDAEARKLFYRQASQHISDEKPVMPFAYALIRVAYRQNLKNVNFDAFGRSWGFVPGKRGWAQAS